MIVTPLLFLLMLGSGAATGSVRALPNTARTNPDSAVAANVNTAPDDAARPRIALVLGGGGARGAAHIGVLKVLEEMRVPVDCVIGTSMGSVIGGLYASGVSPDDLEQLLITTDWPDLFDDAPARKATPFRGKREDRKYLLPIEFGVRVDGLHLPSGLMQGRKVTHLMKTLTLRVGNLDDFDELPLPFRSVACDLDTGEMVVLSSGDLGDAIRASMSIAGAFSPVELDGRHLVDGGVIRNLPVDVARAMAVDVIIAVDVSSATGNEPYDSAVSIYKRNLAIMVAQNVKTQTETLADHDVLIVPQLGDISSSDFALAAEAISIGETEARGHAAELDTYAVDETTYAAYLDNLRCGDGCPEDEIIIDEVRFRGAGRVSDGIFERAIKTKTGVPLNMDTLREDLARIYELGDFVSTDFDIFEDDGCRVLAINAKEKVWGPTFVRFGVGMNADFRGENEYGVIAALRTTRINKLGAEWRASTRFGSTNELMTELYQPLDYGDFFFVNPQVRMTRRDVRVINEDDSRAEFRVRSQDASLHAGVQLGTYGEVRGGVFRGSGTADPRLGPAELEQYDYQTGGWTARLTIDDADDGSFPRSGGLVVIDGVFHRERFGASQSYHRVRADINRARSFGRNTVVMVLRAGSSLRSELPDIEEFTLGGFLSLSGLEPDQIRGPHFGVVDLVYVRELSQFRGLLEGTVYGGLSLETGNAWDDPGAIDLEDLCFASSIFVGTDSVLGPVYFAVGIAEGGNVSTYLSIGGFPGVN